MRSWTADLFNHRLILIDLGAAVGQSFFAWRIHFLGRTVYIPGLIIAVSRFFTARDPSHLKEEKQLTAVQLGAGIWSGVQICLAKRFSQLQSTNLEPTAVRLFKYRL